MDKIYNKLVRDKIPDIIRSNGEMPIIKILNDDDYKKELDKKLFEEYNEVINASGYDRLGELADMIEVIKALAKIEGKSLNDVIKISSDKAEKRGGFESKIFLEKVIENNK